MAGLDETDEEIERRLRAEIAARTAAGQDDDAGFDSLISGLAAEPERPEAPVAAAPRPASTQAGGIQTARTGGNQNALGTVGRDRSAEFRRELADNQQQATKERRRRAIAGALLAPLLRDNTMAFVNQNQDAYQDRAQDIRQRLAQHLEQRQQQTQGRRTALLQQLEAQRRQGNADREFALRQQQADDMTAYRRDQLDQRGEQFTAREAQDMTELERKLAAAAGRARTIAGGMAGRAPSEPLPSERRPGTSAPTEPEQQLSPDVIQADIEALRSVNDIGVREIEAYLQRRGVDTSTPEGRRIFRQNLLQNRHHIENPGSKRAERFWDNIRASEGAGRANTTADARIDASEDRAVAAQDRAASQREQRAIPFEEQANFADEAAAALERIVASTGDVGARVIRGDNFAATAAASMAGADVETDRATFREYLGALLKERGGSALTPAEKRIIEEALASGSLMTSSEATIRTLRNVAARVRRRAQQERGVGAQAQRQAPSAAPPQSIDRNGTSYRLVGRDSQGRFIYRAPNGHQIAARGGQ